EKIRGTNRVISAHGCWGQPDIIAFVEADTQEDLSELVLSELQSVDGVTSTSTHIVIQFD
ncbi:MAG: Lrp/AsnC ligand binding domain-containing protein, partial [Terriglobia bacterium]